MKSATHTALFSRVLFLGVLVMLFTAGCSKHEDDCSAPETSEDQESTRVFVVGDGESMIQDARPSGTTYRGAEEGEGDIDGDGISDDGDDEADGEGNKKGRTQH